MRQGKAKLTIVLKERINSLEISALDFILRGVFGTDKTSKKYRNTKGALLFSGSLDGLKMLKFTLEHSEEVFDGILADILSSINTRNRKSIVRGVRIAAAFGEWKAHMELFLSKVVKIEIV